MENCVTEVLFTQEQIQEKVNELGKKITEEYQGKDLLVVCILKGAMPFMADLIRQIKIPIEIDFMAVSSYGASTVSSGVVKIIKDLDKSIEDRHILIVEDIIDTGLTLKYLVKNLKERKPASIKVCTFLDKPERRKVDMRADYLGFHIPDAFIIGYGLDYNQKFRNLPYIGILDPKCYE